jgi:vancomycin permeability regulator SanA
MSAITLPRTRRPARPLPRWRLLRRLVYLAIGLTLFAVVGLRLATVLRYQGAVVSPEEAPAGGVAIVFGAGVRLDGEPTDVLYDRVAVAAELYRLGKVERLILSGHGGPGSAREPDAMRRVAVRLGVPEAALILDDAGFRTHTTCARAHDVYGVDRAILVTQAFHLPRALLLCDTIGIDATGVAGDRRPYPWRWRLSWQARETVATAVAWWEVLSGGRLR